MQEIAGSVKCSLRVNEYSVTEATQTHILKQQTIDFTKDATHYKSDRDLNKSAYYPLTPYSVL